MSQTYDPNDPEHAARAIQPDRDYATAEPAIRVDRVMALDTASPPNRRRHRAGTTSAG